MSIPSLADYCRVLAPIDALALTDTRCLLLLSHPPDPALAERQSALLLMDRGRREASLLAEFPGAAELVVWARGASGSGVHALVASPGGHLWELLPDGSIRANYDAFGEDGPVRYGYLNCCVEQQGFVHVGGMSNQLYRTPSMQVRFERIDELLLDRDMSDPDSAIYGLCDMAGKHILGVGGSGMIFWMDTDTPRRIDSGTNNMINAVSAIDAETFIACGAGGIVLRGSLSGWCETEDSGLPGVYFSDVKTQGERHLWIGGQKLHVSSAGTQWNRLTPVDGAPIVSRFARGGTTTWAVSSTFLGWTDDGERWSWIPAQSIPVLSVNG